ncbi:MAG: bifunctional nuclease family protein [Candidatus Aenigmatarchaeota archaeon]
MKEKLKDTKYQLLAVAILALVLIYAAPSNGEIPEVPAEDEGFVEAEVFLQDQNLQLIHGCRVLDMAISREQASSIEYGIQGELWERPGSHDLIKDILEGYEIDVIMVRVHDLQENAYRADLFLKKDGTVYRLDSRPSDAIAIALRVGAPVKVEEDLFLEYGRSAC